MRNRVTLVAREVESSQLDGNGAAIGRSQVRPPPGCHGRRNQNRRRAQQIRALAVTGPNRCQKDLLLKLMIAPFLLEDLYRRPNAPLRPASLDLGTPLKLMSIGKDISKVFLHLSG